MEVANDDFERQARNTTSSLEDLESKHNVAIERGVMLEEEIRIGEQERETLRIETQRLRDELSDLKVEAEIMQDKLRRAEVTYGHQQVRKLSSINLGTSRPHSSISECSPETTASSPIIATPPAKSASSAASDTPTPPSPPTSDKSLPKATMNPASSLPKSRLSMANPNTTPRPNHPSTRTSRHSHASSVSSVPLASNLKIASVSRRTTLNRPESRQAHPTPHGLSSSASLTQIRGLIGKMQMLERRVHSARSKLPAPTATPPKASPRPGSAMSQSYIPASITVRSSRKRTGGSITSGTSSSLPVTDDILDSMPTTNQRKSRLSYGGMQPITTRESIHPEIPISRPASRASLSSRNSMNHAAGGPTLHATSSRPSSRQSVSRSKTPLGHYSTSTAVFEARTRPRSSVGGNYASSHENSHGHFASVSRLSNYNIDEGPDGAEIKMRTPSQNLTLGKESSNIPTPAAMNRPQSGTRMGISGRRVSSGTGPVEMGPPLERKAGSRKLSGVGETY